MLEPSWQPDPTGRHDYRWWNGVHWSDQVGDRGVVTIDPVPVAPLADTDIPPLPPAEGRTEPAARPGGRVRRPIGGPRRRLAVAAAGLLVASAAVAVVVRRAVRPASGLGVVQVRLATGDSFGERTLRLDAGDVVRLRVEPAGRLDTRIVVLVAEPTARAMARALARGSSTSGGDAPDAIFDRVFSDARSVLTGGDAATQFADLIAFRQIDTGGAGRPDAEYLTVLVDADLTVVVESKGHQLAGAARLVTERYAESFDPATDDPTTFYAGSFFTEDAFYRTPGAYAPGGDGRFGRTEGQVGVGSRRAARASRRVQKTSTTMTYSQPSRMSNT